MKRTVAYTAILIVMFSCKAQNIGQSSMSGEYLKIVKEKGYPYDFAYVLQLNDVRTFRLKVGRETCLGEWELNDDLILLKCNEEPIENLIASGYMFRREHTVKIISKKKLKFNDVTLKRNDSKRSFVNK
jgi:hypothetical protein